MPMAMTWWQFKNSGQADTNRAVELGIMPQGQLLNGMEIIFSESDAAARGRKVLKGFCKYRMRQTLEEKDFQLVDGRWYTWSSQPAGTPDDPLIPGVISWAPPYFRMIDTPGWSAYENVGPKTRILRVNGVASHVNATEIWVQHIFKTWVEGMDCFQGTWSDVSFKVTWHNSLHLVRATPESPWVRGENCKIGHGPMVFGTTALL